MRSTRLAGFSCSVIKRISLYLTVGCLTASVIGCSSQQKVAEKLSPRDDGSQLKQNYRLNYAGYLPLQEKVAVFISDEETPRAWSLKDGEGKTVASGISKSRRVNDKASGDTFFLIDFSAFTAEGEGFYLEIDNQKSPSFDISNNPYGDLKYEFYDYFKDHRRTGDTFNRYVDNWSDYEVTFDFIADAGDQGYYTVNAAEAQWSLINMLERYPSVNNYYQDHSEEMSIVYNELDFFAGPMEKVIFPGEKLAVAKFATNSNNSWAPCPGATPLGSKKVDDCVSKVETKATFSVARTLAATARLDDKYGSSVQKNKRFELAKTALENAETAPFVCLDPSAFGGEGGYYPNNDNYSLYRSPEKPRNLCATGEADPRDDNTNDDHYAALVELYLAAKQFGMADYAAELKSKIESHSHHNRVALFFWGAVSTEATLSLLTHRPEGMDLAQAEANVFAYSDRALALQEVGYPGVTVDSNSTDWFNGDQDEKDANFRWGSNRMQLNDARIMMFAAELAYENKDFKKAANYTNGVLKVLDQISGTNAVALAMYTSDGYPHIEYAVTRVHDALVPDTEDGKMALGPNNWTNANDPNMPPFGTQPGMKSFVLLAEGWASREISIDGNASIVPVVYFAIEVAPKILAAAQ